MTEISQIKSWTTNVPGEFVVKKSLELESRFRSPMNYLEYIVDVIVAIFSSIHQSILNGKCSWNGAKTTEVVIKWEFTIPDGKTLTDEKMTKIFEHIIAGNGNTFELLCGKMYVDLANPKKDLEGKQVKILFSETVGSFKRTTFRCELRAGDIVNKVRPRSLDGRRTDCARELYHAIGSDQSSDARKKLVAAYRYHETLHYKKTDHPDDQKAMLSVVSEWAGGKKHEKALAQFIEKYHPQLREDKYFATFSQLESKHAGFIFKIHDDTAEFVDDDLEVSIKDLFFDYTVTFNESEGLKEIKIEKILKED